MLNGAEVQGLGYMIDSDQSVRKGEWVSQFVLLPEAGNLLHPAHRIRDQMITVHLEDRKGIQFSFRALIWARGTFAASSEPGVRSKPLYTLERARAQLADKADIQKYFN